ncbi:tRNA (cytidine(34)-2'-O)-methyltransferase [Alphaproteobacteria bacterium]|jgi:tRNA (cytidine/uridine-2'-O-)-methyltransferase|nr:tRNA (cytidine(34)-2'-O)-methyltransferase [Alphaproteobacteria bacterium]MDC3311164.1 tRNA (cytidine(34)-2'-O)-methyltransferase [Alphaproteobacteria bacterium]
MLQIILFAPQIPPNTGNIIRLCANSGAKLHLIKPLGFSIDEKSCRRAGLDYKSLTDVVTHENWRLCKKMLSNRKIWAITKFGKQRYDTAKYAPDDVLLFGSEINGLPDEIKNEFTDSDKLYLPMQADSRSLNLSNSVAICLYEAWRQNSFIGSENIQ